MRFQPVAPVLAALILFALVGTTLAQDDAKADPQKQTKDAEPGARTGHLEVPNQPYRAAPRSGQPRSPGARIERNGNVAVQVNVDALGQNIIGDAANEPSIAVSPVNPNSMAIGWRQFDSVSSDFRQAGYGYTTDGGQTWTFPGVIEPGVFRSDPVLDSDRFGNFYYNSLTATSSLSDFWCHVYKSTDGGATWDAGTYAYGGDKQWQVIDTTGGIGDGNIYANWNSFYSACSGDFTRSTNNGALFQACTYVPSGPVWGTLAVGPDGELYTCGDGGTVVKSTTMQDPGQAAAWDFSKSVDLDGSLAVSTGPNPGGLLGQTWIAVDHSDGATRSNVYLCASVSRDSNSDPLDVMFSRSTDGGTTWSAPVRINDDPGQTAWQWFATMSVAPNGRIDVVWLDTRNDPGGYDSELYYSYSTDAGVTWSANEVLTPSFDPHVGWPQQNKMGDYFDMVSDEFGANLAFAATFNGEQDVYFMRIGDPYCSSEGRASLDRTAYACESTAELQVVDCDLNADDQVAEQIVVPINSTSESGVESVTLTEVGANSGRFVGTITLSQTNAPGVLLVAPGDTITLTYIDSDDGEGNFNVPVVATATVDCSPPSVSNVQVSDIGPFEATITFDASEDVKATVRYGESCAALTGSATAIGFANPAEVVANGLQEDTLYYFVVDAEDVAGNVTTNDNGGACYTFHTTDIPNYYTEMFDASANDLDNTTLLAVPEATVDFYCMGAEPATELPVDPAGGTTLTLDDDDNVQVNLTGGATVSLYGTAYSSFYVGSNGYITFSAGDDARDESFADHFDLPRISALFDDLDPSAGGTISWKQTAECVAVTFMNVPQYNTGDSNTFQICMYFNGDIGMTFLAIGAADGLTGLSQGNGVPVGFYESDLSELGFCDPRPPRAYDGEASMAWNATAPIVLSASDDGRPEPATLVYKITLLPAHGTLADPNGGVIATAPYTLAAEGNIVDYTPSANFHGDDSFEFVANDGGVPPEGGDSNTGTMTIHVTLPSAALVEEFNFDTDPGWSIEGLWGFGDPFGLGSHNKDPQDAYSGTNVYGYNLYGDYANNMASPMYLTTTAIDCSALYGVELRFQRWLGVENSDFDHAGIEVSSNGIDWTPVWTHDGGSLADISWTQVAYDMSAVADDAEMVYVRWSMGPTDSGTTYPGWNIDDVQIWAVQGIDVAGDMNCDGGVTIDDVEQFVAALVNDGGFSGCDINRADVNGDAVIDGRDIQPFLQLIVP